LRWLISLRKDYQEILLPENIIPLNNSQEESLKIHHLSGDRPSLNPEKAGA
jgi:hypothetical protein